MELGSGGGVAGLCETPPVGESVTATAFTVTFESAKVTSNRFIKRHIRNLSLPVVKVYDNKIVPSTTLNGTEKNKKLGNHSEGYFSSDAEDELGNPKIAFKKHLNSPTQEEVWSCERGGGGEEAGDGDEARSEGAPSETGTYTIDREAPQALSARLSFDTKFQLQAQASRDSKDWIHDWASRSLPGPSSSTTYLIPTVNKTTVVSKIPSPISPRARLGSRGKKPNSTSGGSLKPGHQQQVRCRPNSPALSTASSTLPPALTTPSSDCQTAEGETPDGEGAAADTQAYLRTTQVAMSALARRLSLSLDYSGGESDCGGEPSRAVQERASRAGSGGQSTLQRSDSSASESQSQHRHTSRQTSKTSAGSSRYNRAFSLRRGRLEESTATTTGSKKIESAPVKPLSRTVTGAVTPSGQTGPTATGNSCSRGSSSVLRPSAAAAAAVSTPLAAAGTVSSFSRADITRCSVRSVSSLRSPQLSGPKADMVKKKGGGGGGRSNSTLSSKEVEFQNWKRRKSYDPMKAAAEGKKKEVARRSVGPTAPAVGPLPAVMSQSTTNAITTPKSPVNSVLRSASFHTTHQLSAAAAAAGGGCLPPGGSSTEDEDEEEELTTSTEEWPPSSKLPNSGGGAVAGGGCGGPGGGGAAGERVTGGGGSRGSLYSNPSSGTGSPRPVKLEGIDSFIVSAIATISSRVYANTAVILKKLRYIFDEESDKYRELTAELELLEAGSEASSSPTKSTSRDLALSLKNLKRLDSALKVLNDVLLEDIELE